ncbi:unnamed protein product [Hymenolepis diminuta]|uniref:SH2 domain-containing protein n=1 Tax=Hymenolepis diminuta TaxID=6216 RepID=A0A564YYQ9_HYMDI|nr:unnamed protein product [Hymenolepis diminuta]
MATEDIPEAHTYVFALYAYDGDQPGDLSFKSGDLLEVDELPTASESWFQATNPRTGCTGMIPANYVTAERGYSAALDAFNRVSRKSAEALLESSSYKESFNYMIRPSTDNRALALSVRTPSEKVVHLKIFFNPRQHNCFIYREKPFDTIEDLLIYYMENAIPEVCTLQAYKPFRKFPN